MYQQALNHQVKAVSYTTKTWPTSCLRSAAICEVVIRQWQLTRKETPTRIETEHSRGSNKYEDMAHINWNEPGRKKYMYLLSHTHSHTILEHKSTEKLS